MEDKIRDYAKRLQLLEDFKIRIEQQKYKDELKVENDLLREQIAQLQDVIGNKEVKMKKIRNENNTQCIEQEEELNKLESSRMYTIKRFSERIKNAINKLTNTQSKHKEIDENIREELNKPFEDNSSELREQIHEKVIELEELKKKYTKLILSFNIDIKVLLI